jgi:hypothetical protein
MNTTTTQSGTVNQIVDNANGTKSFASGTNISNPTPAPTASNIGPIVYGNNGQVISGSGGLTDPKTGQPKQIANPNTPISSATGGQTNNITTATNNVTNPTPPSPLSDAQTWYMNQSGLTEDQMRNAPELNSIAGITSISQAYRENKQFADQLVADTAQQNADFAQTENKFNMDKQATLDAYAASAAKSNPYGNAGGTNEATPAITSIFDKALGLARVQNDAKLAAIKTGNMAAANLAQANMDKIILDAKTTADNLAQNKATLAETTASRAATLAQNEQVKNQNIADKEMQFITGTTAEGILALPDTTTGMSAADMATLTKAPGYQALIKAGLSPDDALGYIKNAATGNKQQIAQTKADVAVKNSQIALNNSLSQNALRQATLAEKQSSGIDVATLSSVANGVFADAFRNAQLSGNYNKEKSMTSLNDLASYAASGDIKNLKNGIVKFALSSSQADSDTYSALNTLATTLTDIKTRISALPKDQQTGIINGNVVDVAAKLGQSADPQLRTLGQELNHLTPYYAKAILGVRGATAAASGNSVFSNLVPNIKEGKALLFSDIDGFVNTANDLTNNTVANRIGQDTFNNIYGTNGVLGTQPKQPPLTATVPSGSTPAYSASTGHWYAKDASGKVTQIQ